MILNKPQPRFHLAKVKVKVKERIMKNLMAKR